MSGGSLSPSRLIFERLEALNLLRLLVCRCFWRVDIDDAEWMIDQDVHFFITCHNFGVELKEGRSYGEGLQVR